MISPDPDSEWASSIFVRAYGVRFQVRANDASLLPTLVARLPPGTRTCQQPTRAAFCCSVVRDPTWRIFLDADLDIMTDVEAEALYAFEALVRFEVARRTPRWTFVHAGVVGWGGRAILIPGRSFSGKSTLVRALVQAGATYYSDEYAVLDQRGRVYPFAQPLMHRTTSGTRERLTIDDLGGTVGARGLPVGMVVATTYEPGASWNPTPVSPGEGLLALLANTVRAQVAPSRVMRVLAKVAEGAATVESARGDAEDTAADLLSFDAAWHSSRRSIA
mgnify:CR=1 FL=1